MAMVHQATLSPAQQAENHSPTQPLAALYKVPKSCIHTFTTYKKFKEDIARCEDALLSGAGKQYVAFGNVPESRLLPIDHRRECSQLPHFGLLYDAEQQMAIIKLKPGRAHNAAEAAFHEIFTIKKHILGVNYTLHPLGATRYRALSGRSKEADIAYHPDTRLLPTDWPSLVFEVGVSEPLDRLRTEAQILAYQERWTNTSRHPHPCQNCSENDDDRAMGAHVYNSAETRLHCAL